MCCTSSWWFEDVKALSAFDGRYFIISYLPSIDSVNFLSYFFMIKNIICGWCSCIWLSICVLPSSKTYNWTYKFKFYRFKCVKCNFYKPIIFNNVYLTRHIQSPLINEKWNLISNWCKSKTSGLWLWSRWCNEWVMFCLKW